MTSIAYQDAAADARNLSTDALISVIDTLTLDAYDPETDECFAILAHDRLSAFRKEQDRRQRLSAMSETQRAAYDKIHDDWLELARTVKESVSVPEILHLIGYPPRKKGNEYAGPCPICRDGVDRLISWDHPNSRCWCRKCGWKADVIAVTQSFMPGCSHFRDAVRTLAQIASLNEVPQ